MKRKFDVVRIRKSMLPAVATKAPEKGKSPLQVFCDLVKGNNKNVEIEESKDSLIIWETVNE